jgi:hypothetical protein
MAKKIEIDVKAKTITVDGEQFPWHVSQEVSVHMNVGDPGVYRLDVQIYAEEVVINE